MQVDQLLDVVLGELDALPPAMPSASGNPWYTLQELVRPCAGHHLIAMVCPYSNRLP
jgi:hypothetical protein